MPVTSENRSNERYWEVVRLYKEGYSYRKIEALLKDRFGISYREIGYLITSYKVAREAEGDYFEAERKAREIKEEAESEAKKILEEATREAKEEEERTEKSVAEKRKELEELDEISRGARNTVEWKRDEYRELVSSIDSLIVQKRMLTQSVDSLKRTKDFFEEKNHSLQYAYNNLNKRYNELEISSIFTSLTTNEIAKLLNSLPEEKLRKVIELFTRKKGFTPIPDHYWSDLKGLISME